MSMTRAYLGEIVYPTHPAFVCLAEHLPPRRWRTQRSGTQRSGTQRSGTQRSGIGRSTAMLGVITVAALTAGCAADTPPTLAVDTAPNPGEDAIALAAGSTDDEVAQAIADAVDQLPGIIEDALKQSGVPGAAVAVVHGDDVLFSDGFGVKDLSADDESAANAIDDDTVFQVASLSKSVSATAVAKAVTDGAVQWTTPVSDELPSFAMSDAYVTENATVGDYFSHRSGLATGAGDDLEDIGYDRDYIMDHLYLQPLSAFRSTYNYSNFGLTIGAEAAAAALGTSWEDAVDELIYEPLGMTSSSSRYEDYLAQDNRALIHTLTPEGFEPLYERDPDAQSAAGGVSSNVTDMATWMSMVLADGEVDGEPHIDPVALTAATTGEMVSGHPTSNTARTSMYGFGFNTGTQLNGRTSISHSGAFILGAGTSYQMVPSLDLGIVSLTNGGPQGVPEAINAQFLDLVQYGYVTRDWVADFGVAVGAYYTPVGDLLGEEPPADATEPSAAADYIGTYTNDYYGTLTVTEIDGTLTVELGPESAYLLDLSPWDGDEFSYEPTGENAPLGSLWSATFARDGQAVTTLNLAFFDKQGLGTWQKAAA